jgi:hypothetical protein
MPFKLKISSVKYQGDEIEISGKLVKGAIASGMTL